jgi:hypothetical protein
VKDQLFAILESTADSDIASAVTRTFSEIEEAFMLAHWKSAGVSAGHFVEAVRRLVELKLFGSYTPISKTLPPLSQTTMNKYESATGEDGYRLHIPRALLTIYGIRNKRGYGHLSLETARKTDVQYMLNTCRWVLSEIVRVSSNLSVEETDLIVEKVTDRTMPLIWRVGGVQRILSTKLSLKNSILVLLYHSRSMQLSDLEAATESQTRYLKRAVREMHKSRLLELDETRESCELSPLGDKLAEELLVKLST